ncbi:hypothetical protein L6452_22862 [Arctium lappa]|uniref:Uncharacterized protein n=1 Tax=Arctium lappa TaxID=4217 RepID=A0ACB9B037_ARCLA|nr:hypothetical protein L6452_22862 [Arctium lappa]
MPFSLKVFDVAASSFSLVSKLAELQDIKSRVFAIKIIKKKNTGFGFNSNGIAFPEMENKKNLIHFPNQP